MRVGALRPPERAGKEKRIRAVLSRALDSDLEGAAGDLIHGLVQLIRGFGGFRPESENYVGDEAILNARTVFLGEGYELSLAGELHPVLLATLDGQDVGDVLARYIRRAQKGALDAALVVGTGKDLLEATAVYVLIQHYGSYSESSNFPALLGQAFVAKGLATPQSPVRFGEHPRNRLERALYESGCAVNALRNKQGTGHGRPFPPDLTEAEAHLAVRTMGTIAAYLLSAGFVSGER